ncbi:MAG: hypothetical protein NT027_17070 [Proteobacteria bacterium]|nr:hypothetical protein [Pseudomonadota bacterium]
MKKLVRIFIPVLLTGSIYGSQAFGAAKVLLDLDRGEGFNSIAFVGDYLYVGQSRKDFNANYRITVLDRSDKTVAEIPLKHSATQIHPYGNGIIIVGTGTNPNLTYYTYLNPTAVAGKFSAKTVQIPMDAWANDWLGTFAGREYFSDMGGNPHDTNEDINLPSQTIFSTSTSGAPKYMKTRLRGPMFGIIHKNDLIIARFNNINTDNHYLAKVNLQTGASNSALPGSFGKLKDIALRSGTDVVALTEQSTGQITIGDLSKGEIISQFSTAGASTSVTWLGRCLATSNIDNRDVKIFDISDLRNPKEISSLDFSEAGPKFGYLSNMAIDSKTGRIYGKSAIACNPLITDCSNLWNSVAAIDLDSSQILRQKCSN